MRFFKMYNLDENKWTKHMHCGKALYDELRRIK